MASMKINTLRFTAKRVHALLVPAGSEATALERADAAVRDLFICNVAGDCRAEGLLHRLGPPRAVHASEQTSF